MFHEFNERILRFIRKYNPKLLIAEILVSWMTADLICGIYSLFPDLVFPSRSIFKIKQDTIVYRVSQTR